MGGPPSQNVDLGIRRWAPGRRASAGLATPGGLSSQKLESSGDVTDILGAMSVRALSILLVVLMLPHALLGGWRGDVALCLGLGHEHGTTQTATEHHLACDHHHEAAVIPPADPEHDGDCGCIDIEVALTELLVSVRKDADSPSVPLPGSVEPRITPDHAPDASLVSPGRVLVDDRGGGHHVARSVRLLI